MIAAAHAVDATTVLGLLPARPRVLALGEPTHGEDSLLQLRNDLFRQLVEGEGEGEGYRTIALESDCLRGLIVDDYVRFGTGSLDEVMARGFSHGFGASPANRELVRWMRAHNDGRPAGDQVRFAGFDGPLETAAAESPRQALTALHAFLAERVDAGLLPDAVATGPDERWANDAAMMNPAESVGRTPEAVRLRWYADELTAVLETQAPHLIATSTPDAWDRARLYGRTATGLLRYHHWMADASPSRLAGVLGARASMMAANLLALAARGPVLAHANNGHLQRPPSSMRMGAGPVTWWSAGALVGAELGEAYAFRPTAVGTIHHRGVGTPPPDTIEGLLYALPDDRYVIDTRRLAAAFGDVPPPARVSAWFGYAPLDPAHLASVDALLFVRDAPEGQQWWP
jgi:erythromycin esterase-like protein